MFIDLLSKESYLFINKKLVRTIGLANAAYVATILDIMPAVQKKKTVDANGFWPIDREYVESCTGMKEKEQKCCDKALNKLELIFTDPADDNRIAVDLEKLLPIIVDETKCTLDSIKKASKVPSKSQTKRDAQIAQMCMHCDDKEPDEELRELYHTWVVSVFAKNYLTFGVIDIFIDAINEFTEDKEVKKELLRIAATTGYKTPEWVINAFQRNVKMSNGNLTNKQTVATQLNTDATF